MFSNEKFEASGDKVLGTKRTKPRTPISMLRERDTDTPAPVDNVYQQNPISCFLLNIEIGRAEVARPRLHHGDAHLFAHTVFTFGC